MPSLVEAAAVVVLCDILAHGFVVEVRSFAQC